MSGDSLANGVKSKTVNWRLIIKRSAQVLMLPVGVLFWILYCLKALIWGKRAAFACCSQCLSLLPGRCGCLVRWSFYFLAARRCSWDVTIEFGTIFSSPTIELGRHVYIGAYCVLGDVQLSDGVRIASGVSIPSGSRQHWTQVVGQDGSAARSESPNRYDRVTIGEGAWIGERAVILADVGNWAIVGAGSVVTSPVEDHSVAVGVPARVVRRLPTASHESGPAKS